MSTRQPVPSPFPWRSLDSVRRADADATRGLRRAMARSVGVNGLQASAAELLGTTVEARLRRVGTRATASPGAIAVVLERADESGARLVVEVEGALAAAAISRGLRRGAPRVIDPSRPSTEPVAGAMAAIALAVARRAGAPMKVVAAGSSEAIFPSHAAGEVVAATFMVMVEYDAFTAQLVLPASAVALAPSLPWEQDALRALGDLRLALPVVIAASTSTAAEVASLRVGDAWMPGNARVSRGADGAWTGEVTLIAPAAERGLRADLAAGGRVVLREGAGRLGWSVEGDEGEMVDKDALLESVGEVPVIVRVEIGAAELSAREWASVGAGEVIALGRRVGEPVVLRVSGVEVARGELVELEGEVGVRITHKTGSM